MIDWVEKARRRLGIEETDPDHLPPFGEEEAKGRHEIRARPQKNTDKTSKAPSSSPLDRDDSSADELTKLTKLTKPFSSNSIGQSDDVGWSCEPEKTTHSENRTDKTDKTSEAVGSTSSDELTKPTKLTKPPPGEISDESGEHQEAVWSRSSNEPTKPLSDPHSSILETAARAQPPDAAGAQWDAAINGLRAFLASGRADEALRLGWPHDELFAVPPLWANVAACGAALLIGDREVVEIAAHAIRIRAASGSTLSFYRKPAVDYRLVYETRRKSLASLGGDEPHFRAFDHAVNFCRQHSGCDLEQAKATVRAAIAKAAQ
jgi:hypothetical protein